MAKEIEIKIVSINKEEIHKKLIDLGAQYIGKVRQINRIFGDGSHNLLLRLRTEEGKTIFTTKISISRYEYKVAQELETPVSEPDVFAQQLEIMGFPLSWHLEKDRTTYHYKDTMVTIDEYPGIPAFIEIEGTKQAISNVVTDLGYEMKDTCTMNFKELIGKYKPGTRELTFE
jgi:adenylate cyclase class 2